MKSIDKWLLLFALLEIFCLGFYAAAEESTTYKLNETLLSGTTTAAPTNLSNKLKDGSSSTLSESSSTSSPSKPITSSTTSTTTTTTTKPPISKTTEKPVTTPSGGLSYPPQTGEQQSHTPNVQKFLTTTATPPSTVSSPISEFRFDTISFMGGIIFTMCCAGLGVLVWKIYVARLERNYLTI